MKKFFIFTLLAILNYACSSKTDAASPDPTPSPTNPYTWVKSVHTSLGVPFDKDTSDDYLIVRPQYVLSYNKNLNVPNWVAWEVNADWFGDVSRYTGNFITDTSLPPGFYRVKHSDYTNSGYDRGHMCMSEERTATVSDNKATFILSNILPQMPDLNQGVWYSFEKYCNDLALNQNKELFVFAGGIFHSKNMINGTVTIPDSCFKIVVILDKGQGLRDITAATEVIAVVMPNIAGVRSDTWDVYRSTVLRIENSTGYDFLSLINKSVQDILKSK